MSRTTCYRVLTPQREDLIVGEELIGKMVGWQRDDWQTVIGIVRAVEPR